MAEPGHQLGKSRAGLGGEDGAGVAEVVPPEVGAAGGPVCQASEDPESAH